MSPSEREDAVGAGGSPPSTEGNRGNRVAIAWFHSGVDCAVSCSSSLDNDDNDDDDDDDAQGGQQRRRMVMTLSAAVDLQPLRTARQVLRALSPAVEAMHCRTIES